MSSSSSKSRDVSVNDSLSEVVTVVVFMVEEATVVVEGEDVTGLSMYVRDLILSIFLLAFRLLLFFIFNDDEVVETSSMSSLLLSNFGDIVVVVEVSPTGMRRNMEWGL